MTHSDGVSHYSSDGDVPGKHGHMNASGTDETRPYIQPDTDIIETAAGVTPDKPKTLCEQYAEDGEAPDFDILDFVTRHKQKFYIAGGIIVALKFLKT